MKVVWVTGFLNSHIVELAEQFNQKHSFKMIVTEDWKMDGADYGRGAQQKEYTIPYYKSENCESCKQLVRECDFAIFGGGSRELLSIRMETNGLSFLYSERFFKKGTWRRFIPKTRKAVLDGGVKYKNQHLYPLCASAYLPYDLSLLSFPVEKCFKWGYFPKTEMELDLDSLMAKKRKNSILWCARLISLKRVDLAIRVGEILAKNNYDFEMNIVGDGPLKETAEREIQKRNLGEHIHILGTKSLSEVREIMKSSEIFIFTSNRLEGWGAVLNESMNSACAPIASHAIGSVPFLINENETGLVFKSGSAKDLYKKVAYLLEQPKEREKIGRQAYNAITKKWNAEVAVARLTVLAESLLDNGTVSFIDGPCSAANVLKENWYRCNS